MDFSMALGLLGALLVFGFAAGDLRAFFDLASLAIVLGGSLSVLLARTPWQDLQRAWLAAKLAFVGNQRSHQRLTEELLALADLARREGVVALEREPATRPVLMDSCPMLGVLSLSSVFAADGVLIPISADYLAMKGALQMERTLNALEHVLKRRVPRRYLITRYDSRRRMAVDIERQLRERYGDEVCATRIAENVSLAESPANNQDVFDHAPASRGAQHYTELLDELVVAGFMHAAAAKTRPATRSVLAGARTALTTEQQSAVQRQVAAGLKLVHTRQTGS